MARFDVRQNCRNPVEVGSIEKLIKERNGSKLVGVTTKYIYGDPKEVKEILGENTSYVERTRFFITTNGWEACTKNAFFLKRTPFTAPAVSALEDGLYNFTRKVKTLRIELANPSKQRRWQQRSPAMAAGITDHVWTVKELLTVVLVPLHANT
jgi:hypothetical protein